MNAHQLNAALALSIAEALKSCARNEIDPAQIVGVIEMHKAAVLEHVSAATRQSNVIPIHRLPPNGRST